MTMSSYSLRNMQLCKPGAWPCCRAPRCRGWCRPHQRWRASRSHWAHGHGCNIVTLPGPQSPALRPLACSREYWTLLTAYCEHSKQCLDKLYHKAYLYFGSLCLLLSPPLCFRLFTDVCLLGVLNMEDVCWVLALCSLRDRRHHTDTESEATLTGHSQTKIPRPEETHKQPLGISYQRSAGR